MADIGAWLDGLVAGLSGLDPVWLAAMTAAFTALETTVGIGLLVPGDLIVLLAGSTVDGPGRFALVVIAATVGTLTGDMIGYGLGRAAGGRVRASRLGRLLGEARWARAERYLAGRGAPVLVPIRFVSVVHAVAPVVAGTVRMPFRRFVTWAAIGAFVWATCFAAIGTAVGRSYREYGHAGLLTSVCIFALAAVMAARRRRRARHRRREADLLARAQARSEEPCEVLG